MKTQREEYQKKIEAQLDEWRADIDRLKEKAKSASAEAKLKYEDDRGQVETQGPDRVKRGRLGCS
jgi:hypothetical protein